jgi:hypothetical protein
MLRSVNIPAVEEHFNGHGVAYIPILGKYIHGDFIADFTVVPADMILMTKYEFETWVNTTRDYLSYEGYIKQLGKYNIYLKREADSDYLYLDIWSVVLESQEDIDYLYDTLREFNLVIFIDENGVVISGSGSIPLKIQSLY